MTPTWLYLSDGRPFACVYVAVPFPPAVNYGGRYFVWEVVRQRYTEVVPMTPSVVPESEQPPQG